MGHYRTPSKKSKYYLPQQEYLCAIHYALRYPYLLEELNTVANADTGQGINYDKERVQTSNQYDVTAEIGIKRAEISDKIDKIVSSLEEATETKTEQKFLRLHVCYGFTFWQLEEKGMKCGEYRFSNMRQLFYYLLAKKI